MTHNAKEDKNGSYSAFSTKQWRKPTDSTDKMTRKKDCHWDYFFFQKCLSDDCLWCYPSNPADSEISDKEGPLSLIWCHLVSSIGNQGHHFQKIGESKTESALWYADELDAEPILIKKENRQQNTNMFIKKYTDIRFPGDIICQSQRGRVGGGGRGWMTRDPGDIICQSQRGRVGEGGRGWMTPDANCARWTFRSDATF